MRLKNIPGAREIVDESSFVVADPEQYRGRWQEVFGNDHPIELEIGIGKGRFLMDLAEQFPDTNFLGMEMYSSVLFRAVQKAEQRATGAEKTIPVTEHIRPGLPAGCNFRLLRYDATMLTSLFAPGEVAWIYLNFSDPWPKDRHADRRLTSARFLKRYEQILAPGGGILFKTDNRDLFTFSLEQVQECGWKLLAQSEDLHGEKASQAEAGTSFGTEADTEKTAKTREEKEPKWILTEYEEKFSAAGNPIYMMEVAMQ